jgi:hypothetical protein
MSWLYLVELFGGDPREFSGVFWWFFDYLFVTFYNKISGRSLESWIDYIIECRSVICEQISQSPSPIEIQIYLTLENHEVLAIDTEIFRGWAFFDCTDMRTIVTGSGPQPDGSRRTNAFEVQREFYSRYFRSHGLKYLTILLQNGITAAVFGASLSNNDNCVVNLSGLNQHLLSILTPIAETGFYPALYGDAIMQLTPVMLSFFRNPDVRQRIWNRRMSSAHMSIE